MDIPRMLVGSILDCRMFNNYIIGNCTTGSHVSYSTSPFRVMPSSYSHFVDAWANSDCSYQHS